MSNKSEAAWHPGSGPEAKLSVSLDQAEKVMRALAEKYCDAENAVIETEDSLIKLRRKSDKAYSKYAAKRKELKAAGYKFNYDKGVYPIDKAD